MIVQKVSAHFFLSFVANIAWALHFLHATLKQCFTVYFSPWFFDSQQRHSVSQPHIRTISLSYCLISWHIKTFVSDINHYNSHKCAQLSYQKRYKLTLHAWIDCFMLNNLVCRAVKYLLKCLDACAINIYVTVRNLSLFCLVVLCPLYLLIV